jgi:uncharacterized protein YjbI with pentapeptide repeats
MFHDFIYTVEASQELSQILKNMQATQEVESFVCQLYNEGRCENCDLSCLDLREVFQHLIVSNMRVDLNKVNLTGCNMSNLVFDDTLVHKFLYVNFAGADLQNTHFGNKSMIICPKLEGACTEGSNIHEQVEKTYKILLAIKTARERKS